MKAIVYHGKEDFRYEETRDPRLESDTDAIVRVSRTAICGSDLHLWHGGLPEGVAGAGGFAVGHEFVGIVEEAGRGLRGVKKGDRVLTSCTVGCGTCAMCRRGVFSGCKVMTAGGAGASNVFGFSTGLPGGQAEAVRVPFGDTNLFQVPGELSDEQALFLTDILPTGYMGAEMAEVGPGDTVVVFGCGPVGTFAQMSALLRGAARVVAVDLDDLITQAAMVTRPGGRVAVIGVLGAAVATLPWFLIFLKNITLRTGLVNPQIFISRLMPLIESGRLDPTVIISHRLPLSEGPHGYEIFAGHKENALKVILKP